MEIKLQKTTFNLLLHYHTHVFGAIVLLTQCKPIFPPTKVWYISTLRYDIITALAKNESELSLFARL